VPAPDPIAAQQRCSAGDETVRTEFIDQLRKNTSATEFWRRETSWRRCFARKWKGRQVRRPFRIARIGC